MSTIFGLPEPVNLSDVELSQIDEEPVKLFPENQNSNYGLKRKIFTDQLNEAAEQLQTIFNERWPSRSVDYLNYHEFQMGRPSNPPSGFAVRRAIVQIQYLRGPFTPSLRETIVEFFVGLATSPGLPAVFGTSGIKLLSGVALYSGLSGSPIKFYRIVENVAGFSYTVYLSSSVSIDTTLTRELTRITPAGIGFTIDTSRRDPYMAKTGTLTVANAITDAIRVAAVTTWDSTTSGGPGVDDEPTPAGFDIWPASTNAFCYGQCDSIVANGWGATGAGTTMSVDTTVRAPFSDRSIKAICAGPAGFDQGIDFGTKTGQAMAGGTTIYGTVRAIIPVGITLGIYKNEYYTDTTTFGTSVATGFVGTGQWQTIKFSTVTGAGKTTDRIMFSLKKLGNGTPFTMWAANAQIEAGATVTTIQSPYIPTSNGLAAARGNPRVRIPVSGLFTPTQGWAVVCYKPQRASSVNLYGAGSPPTIFRWADNANNILTVYYDDDSGQWVASRIASGVSTLSAIRTTSFNAGDMQTIIFEWTNNTVFLTVNNNARISAANSNIPTIISANVDIGTAGSIASEIQGNLRWAAMGSGVLSADERAMIYSNAYNAPFYKDFSSTAQVKAIVPFDNSNFYVPV